MKTSFPKDKIKVVLVENIHSSGAAMFRSEGFSVETMTGAPDEAKLIKLVENAHVLGIRSKSEVTPNVLGAAQRLLAVGCFCIGTNQVDLAGARRQGVPVFNSPFSNTRSVAELTIAEIIGLYRRLTEKTTQMHAGLWDKSAEGAHEVRGRTLGIVGYGHIGSQVSVLAEAFGMRVLFYDIVAKMPLGNARAVKSLRSCSRRAMSSRCTCPQPTARGTSSALHSSRRCSPGATSSTTAAAAWSTLMRWPRPSRASTSPAPPSTCSPMSLPTRASDSSARSAACPTSS
jgi:D-3-phosphoglycerate dehydrogenase